ncbi:MAG: family 78 glycoside hydrolase catalytic domain [Niabella sp.]|nr:family 78 glycoside hydrolase catalytic domain [Niabella sp.]
MKIRMRFFFAIVLLCCFSLLHAQEIKVTKLSCTYAETPMGIDIARPRLGWQLLSEGKNKRQSAYEIVVSDRPGTAEKGQGTMWSTGKVQSDSSAGITYRGQQLQSFTRYYWKVRVYDEKGNASAWSRSSWFETAMLDPLDWKAQWISDGKPVPERDADFYKEDPMPVFKKQLLIKKAIRSARLYIAGAGYFEAYLNGEKIGTDQLAPAWTNFDKRVLYRTYDITAQLKQGGNTGTLLLGNGWYNPLPLRFWGRYNLRDVLATGRPAIKAQYRITYTDGSTETIVTDATWKWTAGPVVQNNVYLGETFDNSRVPETWMEGPIGRGAGNSATVVAGPKGSLEADLQPPIRVRRIIKPIVVRTVGSGKYVADMGENFAGVAQIHLKAPKGTRITLRYGEDINKDGTVNGMTAVAGQIKHGNGGPGAPEIAFQEDHFIAGGKGIESWHPRFTFHVFRYVEITGWPGTPTTADIEGLQMNADVPVAGQFTCSNPLLNKIQDNVLRTFKSNLFSVQSDCAGREKFGYGGDLFCTLESFSYNFDMHNFYRKSVQDFADDQRPLGGITETAPFVGLYDKGPGDGSGPLGWQLGYPYLIKKLYEFYGDKHVIEKYYPSLTRQIHFLMDSAKDNLYYQDISDHEALDEKPEALTASLFYYHHVQLMKEFAGLLNKKEDAARYAALEEKIKAAILKRFYKGGGVFDNHTESAQLFALWYGLPDGKEKQLTEQQLLNAFSTKNNHVSTGIFSTKMLFDVLRDMDKNELAYTVANQKDFPGWGYMVEKGATTVWETWKYSDNTYSQNHPMFGSVTEWFYRSLLGINSTAPGFKTFKIQPQPVQSLQFANGYYETPYGKISSSWQWKGQLFTLTVSVPVNTTAVIWVPSDDGIVLINGKRSEGNVEGHYKKCAVGSGHYTFTSSLRK